MLIFHLFNNLPASTLTSPSTPVEISDARRVLEQHYALSGELVRLEGERDQNFLLRAPSASYFFKVVHADEPTHVTSLGTAVLLHLAEAAPEIPTQRVVPTTRGSYECAFETADGESRTGRLTTYVPGRLLASLTRTPAIRECLGRTLAQLVRALNDFEHPGAQRDLLWDLATASRTRPLIEDLGASRDTRLLSHYLDQFESSVDGRLQSMRTQVVHNDLNSNNTLLTSDGKIGVLDFGDMVRTQIVNDLAVAATDQLSEDEDSIRGALDVVRGFHDVIPLERPEMEILFDLIRLRLVITIIITEWRTQRFPENGAYISRKTARSWRLLERLPLSSEAEATQRIISTCTTG